MQTETKPHVTAPSRDRLRTRLDELQALRDEIRVRLHLAGLDVKDAFHRVEPSVDKAELELQHMAKDAGVALGKTLDRLGTALRTIRRKLPKE